MRTDLSLTTRDNFQSFFYGLTAQVNCIFKSRYCKGQFYEGTGSAKVSTAILHSTFNLNNIALASL